MVRKITTVCGNISDLINVLGTVAEDCGDIEVTVCGSQAISIYHADGENAIVLDDNPSLDEK